MMQSNISLRQCSITTVRTGRWLFLYSFLLTLLVITIPRPVVADPDHEIDTANWIALPLASVDGFFPNPWQCGGSSPNPQSILQFHENWHCTNPDHVGSNWGNRFFGFHKQFLLGYNHYLASVGERNVQTWVASPGALIPPAHGGRPRLTPCRNCEGLDNSFKVPAAGGTLDRFTSVTNIGDAIVSWHNRNHGNIAAAGGTGGCGGTPDMNCPRRSPNDPIFYRYHHIFDDVQDAWRSLQPTDIALVLDRSGSMSLPTSDGGTRLDAAKSAASLFADLLEDRSSHKLGLVSFSTTATSPADLGLTDVLSAPAALSAALAGIVPSGSTSIGDGLQNAQALINSGSEPRKAILLLTDGQENTPPTIADVRPSLSDTHVCSIGFGTPGSLDGPKLQDLSERQGGIYISTTDPLELKKYFVFCFANLFDTFVGEDPIDTLLANQLVSTPTVHHSLLDDKLVFILGWTNPVSPGNLKLAITTPSGSVLNLDSPGVQSKFGPTWHIVRLSLPYNSERDGNWTARAIRPIRTYVNGFSSRSFADFEQGVGLVQNQLASLCTNGCRNVLYYEDTAVHSSFVEHNSIYAEALFRASSQGTLGTITRPANASEFAEVLRQSFGQFDLLVYSSQFTEKEQPYDNFLAELLCSSRQRSIISDSRRTGGARNILRCVGALRGERANFTTIVAPESLLLDRPAKLRFPENVIDSSYELIPTDQTIPQASSDTNVTVVLAQGETGKDEKFFITVLTRSTTKVKPFTYRNNTYTLEPLHPTFHIPEMYWPSCGFDNVTAVVNITRPLRSLAELLASVGSTTGTSVEGDFQTPREVAAQRLESQGISIPTESRLFNLYDDGTNGDSTANDHYWEVSLPPDFTAVDGDYHLHAYFRLCKSNTCGDTSCGETSCVEREAEQTITIRTQVTTRSQVTVETLEPAGGRLRSRVLITPIDVKGTLLGPGLINELLLTPIGDVRVEQKSDLDGRGTYQIFTNWRRNETQPSGLTIAQFGRPANAIRVTF
jgi:hypothetical protein